MASHIAIFVASLAILAKSADWLVEYGARLARRLGVSDLIIGLTLTAIGTSVPELASSISASVQHNSGLVIGNVVGSNIANIGLIVGCAALIRPFRTEAKMHERDGFILLAASGLFFALVLDNRIDRLEAAIALALYVTYIGFAARSDRDSVDHRFRYFLQYIVNVDLVRPLFGHLKHRRTATPNRGAAPNHDAARATEPHSGRHLAVEILAVVASCVGVVVGARYMVSEATWGAAALGVPDSVIGLSLVAVGTSLPELIVALTAARKGNAGMVIGNVIGSNLANTLLIVGVAGSINPMGVAEISVVYTIPIMLFFTLGLLYIVKSGWRVTRIQGALVLLAYLAFMTLAFVRGWS